MNYSRRTFLKSSALLAITAPTTFAAAPIQRKGKGPLKLGLAAYSFRNFFKDATHERPEAVAPDKQIDLFQFIDFCADNGCAGAELTAYYFPSNVSPEFLNKLKRHAFTRGVSISGSAVGNTFTQADQEDLKAQKDYVKQWIDYCAALGAPHLRVFAGSRRGLSQEEARKQCIGAMEECCAYAANKGVFLGLENHGGIVEQVDELIAIVEAVKSDWLGINLDTGNFYSADPYKDLEKCAPYAVNVQLKSELKIRGKTDIQETDIPRVISILRKANYQGFVTLEYEAQPDPWQSIPGILDKIRQVITS